MYEYIWKQDYRILKFEILHSKNEKFRQFPHFRIRK